MVWDSSDGENLEQVSWSVIKIVNGPELHGLQKRRLVAGLVCFREGKTEKGSEISPCDGHYESDDFLSRGKR